MREIYSSSGPTEACMCYMGEWGEDRILGSTNNSIALHLFFHLSKALFPFFQHPCLSISQPLTPFLSISLCHSADQRGAHNIEISWLYRLKYKSSASYPLSRSLVWIIADRPYPDSIRPTLHPTFSYSKLWEQKPGSHRDSTCCCLSPQLFLYTYTMYHLTLSLSHTHTCCLHCWT